MKVDKSKYLKFEKLAGKRRTSSLIYVNKHKCLYVGKSKLKKGRDFICYQTIIQKNKMGSDVPKCTARVQIDSEGICKEKSEHSIHVDHELIYKDMKTKNNFLDEIVSLNQKLKDIPVNVSNADIFTREMAKRELGESNLRFESLERNARRYKETFPPMPKCPQHIIEAFSDTKIFDKFAFNLRRTHQFYIGTVEYDAKHFFSVFASHQIMDMIEKNIPQNERNYLIDGTLKVTPIGGFYQLMVIHIEYKNDVLPLIYVTMSGKSASLYEKVFEYIEENIFKLRPARFMTDFENGLRAAIKRSYPEATLNGCWFHFTAAIRRRILSLHLYGLIKDNPKASFIYRAILSLPLLPTNLILEGYSIIKRQAKLDALFDHFKAMFDYFESFWLALHAENSLSVANLNMRTVSSLESFHSALNRSMPKKSNFFRFIVGLKMHESRKADKMSNLVKDSMPKNQLDRRHKKDKKREIKIAHLTALIIGKHISIKRFLQDMAEEEDIYDHDHTSDFDYPLDD